MTHAVQTRANATHGSKSSTGTGADAPEHAGRQSAVPGLATIRRAPTEQQKKVREDKAAQAKKLSAKAKKKLLARCKEIGIKPDELELIKEHIRKAEVTINFKAYQVIGAKPLPQLLSENGVKNLFETGTSGGSADAKAREEVERDMFGYTKIDTTSSMDEKAERPRYASVNPTTSALGGADTSSYGSSALVLNDDVRKRSTITYDDSFAAKDPDTVGTFDDLDHVLLQKFTGQSGEDFAKTVLAHAQGKRAKTQGFAYLEVQIHDKIDIDKDVAYVRANFNEAFGSTNGEALRAMAKQKPVIWGTIGVRDQMILQPDKGPAKDHFDQAWATVKAARAQAQIDGKPIETVVRSKVMTDFWNSLLPLMPPANLFVTDDKKDSLPQISGGARPEDREDITNLEVKVLLGKP